MKIVTVPNKVLTTPTRFVGDFGSELQETAKQMEETVKSQRNPEGVGLSANQVGIPLRLALIRLNPEEKDNPNFLAVVNPTIVKSSKDMEEDYEGCLSIPNAYAKVNRDRSITVGAQDLSGNPLTLKVTGFLARIFQHEIDHLDGVLITDRAIGKVLTEEELEKLFSEKS